MGLPTPVYVDPMTALYQGDALQLMPELDAGSVSLIIADVPYMGVKTSYLGQRLEWDRQWPTRAAYLAWLRRMAHEWQRVLSPNGSLYCFASPQMAAHVEVMLEDYFTVIQRITWAKPRFATKAEMFRKEDLHSFFPVTEAILFCEQRQADAMALGESGYAACEQQLKVTLFSQPIAEAMQGTGATAKQVTEAIGAYGTVNHGGAVSNWLLGYNIPTRQQYEAMRAYFHQRSGRHQYLRADYEALRADYEALRRPFTVTKDMPYTDIWTFNTVPATPSKHAAEKPLPLLRHMIEVSSRPGDLVLDPTCGSGSTLDAARQCGRRSLGFDHDARAITLAHQRLAQQSLPWDAEENTDA